MRRLCNNITFNQPIESKLFLIETANEIQFHDIVNILSFEEYIARHISLYRTSDMITVLNKASNKYEQVRGKGKRRKKKEMKEREEKK